MFEKYLCCKTYIIPNLLITNYFTIKIFLKKYNSLIQVVLNKPYSIEIITDIPVSICQNCFFFRSISPVFDRN